MVKKTVASRASRPMIQLRMLLRTSSIVRASARTWVVSATAGIEIARRPTAASPAIISSRRPPRRERHGVNEERIRETSRERVQGSGSA